MKRTLNDLTTTCQKNTKAVKLGKRLRKLTDDEPDCKEPKRTLKRLKRQKSPPGEKTSSLNEESGKEDDSFESDFIDDGEPEVLHQNDEKEESEASCNEDYSDSRMEEEQQKGFEIEPAVDKLLFEHQRIGVKWLHGLFEAKKGGVLGDDMGLGKTVQVAVYLRCLFNSDRISRVLVVVPATMKIYWQRQLHKWINDKDADDEEASANEDDLSIIQFDDSKRKERQAQIKQLRKHGGILITSYGMVSSERLNLQDMSYDVIVLDEGHKAKNRNTAFRRDITALRVKKHRIILTGTPLQNNFSELWSVFDLVQPKIFGSFDKFQARYGNAIERGLMKNSTAKER